MADPKKSLGLQWWIMSAMWAVVLAGGGGWAAHVSARIHSLEIFITEKLPEMRRTAINDHEGRLHRDLSTTREVSAIDKRLDRIEAKIDELVLRK